MSACLTLLLCSFCSSSLSQDQEWKAELPLWKVRGKAKDCDISGATVADTTPTKLRKYIIIYEYNIYKSSKYSLMMVPVVYVILVVFQSVFWVGCGNGRERTRPGSGTHRCPALPCPSWPPRSWLVVVTATPLPLPTHGLSSTSPPRTDDS